jgi:hypothetical protein
MKAMKLIVLFCLCFTTITYSSISVTPITGEDDYYYYNVDVVLEGDKYVEGFGNYQGTTTRTYYEWILITPSDYGVDYTFSNYTNSLQGSNGSTTDTQLLLYDSDNIPDSSTVIIQAPQIYNNSASFGFGGGQTNSMNNSSIFADDGPFDATLQLNEEQYLVVFTSFRADALGSMSVDVHGPNSISWSTIPEPATFGLTAIGVTLLWMSRKKYLSSQR